MLVLREQRRSTKEKEKKKTSQGGHRRTAGSLRPRTMKALKTHIQYLPEVEACKTLEGEFVCTGLQALRQSGAAMLTDFPSCHIYCLLPEPC